MAIANLDSVTVDASGRASFSGLGSGIDFVDTTDKIMAAKRIPAVTLESRIEENDLKIAALNDMRALLGTLQSAVSGLRGAVSVGGTTDIFSNKQTFASTTRSDGQAPSAAGSLVGVTTTNAAAAGTHTVEVRRIAAAHKVSSDSFASTSTDLGFAGTVTVGSGANATDITVVATDDLLDVRDRINNANSGTTPSGVAASVVSVSATENYLILTSSTAGANMTVTDSGTVLSSLGLSTTNGLGDLRNGLSSGSKVEVADGFSQIAFDGTTGDAGYLVSYDSGTKSMTLTRGDGQSQSVTLETAAIGAGLTETAAFSDFGVSLVLDENFDKDTSITVAADTTSVTNGTGVIDAATVKIFDSAGDTSGITGTTMTFGNFASPAALTVSMAGGFTGTVDASSIGLKTVTMTDGTGNELLVQFNVTTLFDGSETAASIELNEMQNLVSSNDSQFSSVLQVAQTARLTADGLTDKTHFESQVLSTKTAALSNFTSTATFPGSFDIVGTSTATINFTSRDTLETLRDKINAATATTGVTARVIGDANGFRIDLDASAAFSVTDTNSLLNDLGVSNALVITRATNTVSDLFNGVTLSLFQQESGSAIKIEIEQDLSALKTQIQSFVDSYNAVRVAINGHNKFDTTSGAKAGDAGVLFGDSVISAIQGRLAAAVNGNVDGVDADFSVLSQIGVNLIDNASLADPLNRETLTINQSKLDEVLLNSPEDVRRLFGFDFSSSNPDVIMVEHTVNTAFSTTGYTLNINYNDSMEGTAVTNSTVFAQTDADTGGPAEDGISAITFGSSVATDQAFRYSYNSSAEQLTLVNLTAGTSEVISVASAIDAATGVGEDLEAGETAVISFPTFDTTITLSGDDGFLRGADISDGTLDSSALAPNMTLTGGAVATPTSGIDKATVDALIAAGAYDQATGLLTLGIGSTGAGEAHVNTATGIKFNIDGGGVLADISATDLDDAGAHSIGIFVNDGSSDVLVATLSFTTLTGAALDAGKNITIDLGTGLTAESSTITSATAPMSNYFSVTDGSFEIRDSDTNLIGTVNYLAAESLTDVAATADAISGISAQVVASGDGFFLQITEDTNDAITLASDTGSLVSEHAIIDAGATVFSANYGGAANGVDDGSATVASNIITATSTTGAEGLQVLFTGNAESSAIQIDFTIGAAANLFFDLDQMLDLTSGSVQGQVAVLEGRNELAADRIETIDRRIEVQRDSMIRRFIAAEQALASMKSLLDSISATFNAISDAKQS
jgi:flagellar capping protein FliD